ncbi:MAG: site-specific integrase [Deltaproteobacteria bacterium]|nr:site-specific integrase [Deltaproteobacteria bacterium]
MKLATSGSRGVIWRASPRGTQELRRPDGRRERGDWWIRWACSHDHLHRAQVGPKSLATQEVQRKRLERPCPRHQRRPATYLLADVIREYLVAAKVGKRSFRNDERYGKAWTERLGSRSLEEVTPADLEKIRAERLASRRRRAKNDDKKKAPLPLAAATVNREYAFLKHVFNVAIRDGKTERNPVAKLKMLREPSGRVRYLSDEEEKALRGKLASDEGRDRLQVLLQTGLRKSEFLGLRWKDLDFKAGVLTIPLSKHGEARHVPLTSAVRAILARRPRSLDATALVFPNSLGNTDFHWAEKDFPEAVAGAEIKDFRLHDTRHTFASRLAMEGVDLLTLKELGGWKTLSMVQRYAHLSPGHQRQAIERLVTRVVAVARPAEASGRE